MFSFRKHKTHNMNSNSTHVSMCEHSVVKLMTHSSESQDDLNKCTSDYGFWNMNPGNMRQRRIGSENKNEGDEVKGHLF